MITAAPYLLTSQFVYRNQMQMYQASLRNPTVPLSAHAFHPLYVKQQQWSLQTASTLSVTLEAARLMEKAAKPFDSNSPGSAINSRKTAVSDKNALSATALSGAKLGTYRIGIQQLAATHTHKGNTLASQATTSVQGGINKFGLTINGKEHDIQFFSFTSDTHDNSLTRMAEAINQKKLGVTARVERDQKNGTSQLVIASHETGEKQRFSLRDLEGNSVTVSGANQTTQQGEDALYTVDGKSFRSASNRVRLPEGVEVQLHKQTSQSVELNVSADANAITAHAEKLVAAYNRLESFLDNTHGKLSFNLKGSWEQLMRHSRAHLETIGITRSADGSLRLDQTRLRHMTETNFERVQQALSGPTGFATRVLHETERMQNIPMGAYLPDSKAYGRYVNPYTMYTLPSMFYRQAASTGILFNQIF